MPEPSKESLACGHPKSCERIIQRGCDVCPECVHTICGWCEQVDLLRQQNAALVEALRLAEKYLPIGGEACLYCDNDGEEHDYRCFVTKIRAALAPYAPADALERKEK